MKFQERELQKQLIQLQAQYNQSLEERKEKEALVRAPDILLSDSTSPSDSTLPLKVYFWSQIIIASIVLSKPTIIGV